MGEDVIRGDGEIGDVLAETVSKRSYARVLPDGRRETWAQAVDRSVDFLTMRGRKMIAKTGADLAPFLARMEEVREAMLAREVMPSMRLFWSAGVSQNDISFFNCASVGADSPAVFWEALYVLMHGTGLGYSVEEDVVALLPVPLPPKAARAQGGIPVHVVGDSKEGWRDAVEAGVGAWFLGSDVVFDYSKVRPKDTPLKTSGGLASGPEPLRAYLDDLRAKIQAAGRQRRGLTTVEVSDLLCRAGQAVHVGGVRRSAMIGLFSPKDAAMAAIKDWTEYAKTSKVARLRGQVNISALTDDPLGRLGCGDGVLTDRDFRRMWGVLADGKSGEPGVISSFRNRWRLDRLPNAIRALARIGFNPCVEIALILLLRAMRESSWYDGGGQVCNLTTAPLRPDDTVETAARKVRLAAFIGTIQAGLTDFKGLRPAWKENTDRDALLGVCLSGHADCMAIATDAEAMRALNRAAIEENEQWAPILGVNVAAAVTAVKPDGNSGQVLGMGNGFHGYYSEYFLRRVAIDSGSPIAQLLLARGFPAIPSDPSAASRLAAGEIGVGDVASWSFEFPRKAPAGALIADTETALEQAQRYLTVLESYTGERGHNVSATIYVRPHEWAELGDWVWAHIDRIGGLSFYPVEDHQYHAAPLEALTAERYVELLAALPVIDWADLAQFETGVSEGSQTVACAGGACSL
jgi:ribonucleoside-diphosphate reductase alpha chain